MLIVRSENVIMQEPARLRLPLELRTMIYKFLFENTALDVDNTGLRFVQNAAIRTFMDERKWCLHIFRKADGEKFIYPVVLFRVSSADALRVWLNYCTAPVRDLFRYLEIYDDQAWNCSDPCHGYSPYSNPVNKCPPPWFTILNMSLATAVPNLKRLHVRVKFETEYFMGLAITERRQVFVQETDKALEHWKTVLKSCNPGVGDVVVTSDSVHNAIRAWDELLERTSRPHQ
jgi:hypothetical protein